MDSLELVTESDIGSEKSFHNSILLKCSSLGAENRDRAMRIKESTIIPGAKAIDNVRRTCPLSAQPGKTIAVIHSPVVEIHCHASTIAEILTNARSEGRIR